jgi:hypothetical protein
MYRAVELAMSDRGLHRFVWDRTPKNLCRQDYRMTRVTFGVSVSSFAANMAVKQNTIDHAHEYPLAAEVVKSFYVDDCLSGVVNTVSHMMLRQQLRPDATGTAGTAMAVPLFVPIIQGAREHELFLPLHCWL